MGFIEKSSRNIAEIVSREMNHSQDKKEVIEYGAFVIIHTICCICISLLVAYIFGLFFQTAIIFIVVGLVRTFSGGAHCSSPARCAVAGAVTFLTLAYFLSQLNRVSIFYIYEIYILVCMIGSLIIIRKYAPVDCENKPIRRIEVRASLRKKSLMALGIFAVIIIFIENLISNKSISHIINLSIVTGTIWQSFTLTPQGHKFVHFIDKKLSIILR